MSFYPHGTLVHFGWKKWWPNVVGMPRPTGALIGKGVPEPIFLTDQGGFFLCPISEAVLKSLNSSIVSGPSGAPEAAPEKDRICKKTSFHLHGTHVFFADYFRRGPPAQFRRGCEQAFSRWCPAGLKMVLRQLVGNPQIGVSRW